jgi:lipopolysaccharide biosynthesis regulator YciM
MGAALVLLLVALGALAAGVLVGRYYVPDDRQVRRTARHARAYMRAVSHLIARDHGTVIDELRAVVEENVEDVEPYFALGALFRSRGEHERAIRVHQALALRERDRRKLRQRALYELGMDFRAAGMPRRATRAMEEVLLEDPTHEGGVRSLASLYEEQGRFAEAAALWDRLGARRTDDLRDREHHLRVAAAQASLARGELDAARAHLKAADRLGDSAHAAVAAAELAAARRDADGAKDQLLRALALDAALAPHVLPGLLAAERTLAAEENRPEHTAPGRAAAALAQIEADAGPRLPLTLVRAELAPADDRGAIARDLSERFPSSIAARVAAARLALATREPEALATALTQLVGDEGALAWAVRGRWQCARCGDRPATFAWRCAKCRQWGTLGTETGIEPLPLARERRARPRASSEPGGEPIGAPGAQLPQAPAIALPAPTLDSGLSDDELATGAAPRRSLLGRVGGWFGNVRRRDA